MNANIQLKIKELPTNPGVYIMRDKDGTVIYVGKARNLKNRVRSYFNSSVKTEKTYALVEKIVDFDYIIAKSEENKQTFAKNEIETITAIVVKEFDSKIAELKSLIKE